MYYRRTAGGWEWGSIKRVLGRGGVCIIPTPHPIILLLTSRGWGDTIYIRYKPPPHRSIIPIYIRYGFLFVGLGV